MSARRIRRRRAVVLVGPRLHEVLGMGVDPVADDGNGATPVADISGGRQSLKNAGSKLKNEASSVIEFCV